MLLSGDSVSQSVKDYLSLFNPSLKDVLELPEGYECDKTGVLSYQIPDEDKKTLSDFLGEDVSGFKWDPKSVAATFSTEGSRVYMRIALDLKTSNGKTQKVLARYRLDSDTPFELSNVTKTEGDVGQAIPARFFTTDLRYSVIYSLLPVSLVERLESPNAQLRPHFRVVELEKKRPKTFGAQSAADAGKYLAIEF